MSSNCYLTVEDGHSLNEESWAAFAAENGIVYSPNMVGGKTWYAGEVEVQFEFVSDNWLVTFGTFFMGPAMSEVARLAVRAWYRFGGTMGASPEIIAHITSGAARLDPR